MLQLSRGATSRTFVSNNRTDMGTPVFWTTASSDPPWNFKIWFDQFVMAVTVKENVDPEELLEDTEPVIEEPASRREIPRTGENVTAVAKGEARERMARDKVQL